MFRYKRTILRQRERPVLKPIASEKLVQYIEQIDLKNARNG
jgi:hypothetical protein